MSKMSIQEALTAYSMHHADSFGADKQLTKEQKIETELATLSARLREINTTPLAFQGDARIDKEGWQRFCNNMKAISGEKERIQARINELVEERGRIVWREKRERTDAEVIFIILHELESLRIELDELKLQNLSKRGR